jgi:hypothetical protein
VHAAGLVGHRREADDVGGELHQLLDATLGVQSSTFMSRMCTSACPALPRLRGDHHDPERVDVRELRVAGGRSGRVRCGPWWRSQDSPAGAPPARRRRSLGPRSFRPDHLPRVRGRQGALRDPAQHGHVRPTRSSPRRRRTTTRSVLDFEPDVIGIYATTGQEKWPYPYIRRWKKELPHLKVVMGGPHPSHDLEPLGDVDVDRRHDQGRGRVRDARSRQRLGVGQLDRVHPQRRLP